MKDPRKNERKTEVMKKDRRTEGVLSCCRQIVTALLRQVAVMLFEALETEDHKREYSGVTGEEGMQPSCEPLFPLHAVVNYCFPAMLATEGFIWRIEMVVCVTSESSSAGLDVCVTTCLFISNLQPL